MKRLILIALSVLFFTNLCHAQGGKDTASGPKRLSFAITSGYGPAKKKKADSTKRFVFGFNDGYGIPIGNFRKTDQAKYPVSRFNGQDTNHLGGYGQYGFHYEYYVSCKIYRHLFIMLSLGGSDIGFDINTMNTQFMQYFPPNTVALTSGDNYNVIQYLIGPNLYLPLGKNFSIECKALAGITSTNYPSLSFIGMKYDSLGTQVQQSRIYTFPQGYGFGYNVGLGLRYVMVEGHIGIHVNVNYAGATVNFSSYNIADYTPPNLKVPANANIFLYASNYNYQKTLDVSMLQITFGLTGEF